MGKNSDVPRNDRALDVFLDDADAVHRATGFRRYRCGCGPGRDNPVRNRGVGYSIFIGDEIDDLVPAFDPADVYFHGLCTVGVQDSR